MTDYLKVAEAETDIDIKERVKLNKLNTIFLLLNFERNKGFKYEDGE